MKNAYDLFIGMTDVEAMSALQQAENYLHILDKDDGPNKFAFLIPALMFISDGGSVPQPFDVTEFNKRIDSYVEINIDKVSHKLSYLIKLHKENNIKQEIELKAKDLHKTLSEGTTDEIAKKLGISKSEVRKLKREGKLEERLNSI